MSQDKKSMRQRIHVGFANLGRVGKKVFHKEGRSGMHMMDQHSPEGSGKKTPTQGGGKGGKK